MSSKKETKKGPVTVRVKTFVPLFADVSFFSLVICLLDKTYIWPETNTLSSLWPVSVPLFSWTTISPSKISYFFFGIILIFLLSVFNYRVSDKNTWHTRKKQHLHIFFLLVIPLQIERLYNLVPDQGNRVEVGLCSSTADFCIFIFISLLNVVIFKELQVYKGKNNTPMLIRKR